MNKRTGREKRWIGLVVMILLFGGVCCLSVLRALAAPEDPAVEEMAEMTAIEITPEEAQEEVPEEISERLERAPGQYVVVVDAGHGGLDEGCSSDETLEKEINLAIARQVEAKLTQLGYLVVMARTEDIYIAKEDRVDMANRYEADAYVSIHQNSYEEKDVKGIETWYDATDTTRDSKRLAQLVNQETVRKTGAQERQLQGDSQLHVTTQTTMPACLIETGFLSNAQEKAQLITPEYQELIAAGIVQGIDYFFHPKTMYLTFDDGPSADNTAAVLDVLQEKNIKATFFVVGENVRKNPEIAKRIVAEGHAIGIHCNRHDYEAIYESVDSYIQDFEEAYAAVLEVTGTETKLFRFPGGSINSYNQETGNEIIKEMAERGFIYFDWNASLEDAVQKAEPDQLIQNAKDSTLGRKRVILLAHDVVYNTTLCLGELLESFPEYKMELLTTDVEPVQFPLPEEETDN